MTQPRPVESYQSPRFPGDPHRIWLAGRSDDGQWADLQDIGDEFLPEYWTEAVAKGLPAGGAYFQCAWFAKTIQGKRENPVDVHRSLDYTLPGLVGQLSIADGGRWMDVPDSRTW